jgi:hypothetical protein
MSTKKQNGAGAKSFLIANPIYDTVFKKLMENMRIAKFFLSTILEQQITEVAVLPQEFTYKNEEVGRNSEKVAYSMLRIDFMATIQTEGGEKRRILIEVQKSWALDDVMRFRKYLGEQYGKMDTIVNGKKITLPITTIYILGTPLAEVDSPCVKVGRTYMDMRNRKPISAKSKFIELLTHDSYVIQTSRITDIRYTTNLDKLLSIFEQAYFTRKDSEVVKEYRYQPDDDNIDLITSVLYEMAADPEECKRIEVEEEALRIIDDLFGYKIRESASIIEEQVKSLEQKDKSLEEKDKAIEKKDKAIEEQVKSIEDLTEQVAELKRLLTLSLRPPQ